MLLLTTALLAIALAAPAEAVDADRRTGPEHHRADVGGVHLLADLRPEARCLRVRTVPVSTGRDLLYVPCQDNVLLPAPKPWGDRPPIIIPVEPRR